jgi:hypothetical protein
MLSTRRITLLNPRSWEDRNDSFYIEQYKEKKKLKSVLALCFTTSGERFHHWKVFSDGSSGVCVEFDKERLLEAFHGKRGFHCRMVEYRKIEDVEAERPKLRDWPFLKRIPFMDEGEFRIIYESHAVEIDAEQVPFKLDSIRRITLSPWLPKPVFESVKEIIQGIDGCDKLTVSRSTLIDYSRWRGVLKRAAHT